jgi:hypothetical protein
MNKLPELAICEVCKIKYPKMAKHKLDSESLQKYGCEVCEGDTDPAL